MNIGIMQGRVLPNQKDKLQNFPNRWKEEFREIKNAGFSIVELLDDKEEKFKKMFTSDPDNFFREIKNSGLRTLSVCADNLCKYNFLSNKKFFVKRLEEINNYFKKIPRFVIVIPFFDNNKIKDTTELELTIKELSKYLKIFDKAIYSLELDFPAEDLLKVAKYIPKNAGFCYDLGNRFGKGADLAHEIVLLGSKINHIHIKYKENGANSALVRNNKSYREAFKTLKRIKYNGLYVLETCIIPEPKVEAKKNLEIVKKYLQTK